MAFVLRTSTAPMPFVYPENWPKPAYDFSKNPITLEGFGLGRRLFYDPILSKDSTISCQSCHLQATGFTHVDHALSHGIEGRIGTRNTMTLMNLAWNKAFMWDGGVNHLDVQPLAPITSHDEMDETLANVVQKINRLPRYRARFCNAFGDSTVTGQRVLLALSQFMLQLVSYNSKYDRYIRHDSTATFTVQEQNGLKLFDGHCNSCHTAPLFTNRDFERSDQAIDPALNDMGRMKITQNLADSLHFKVPTLRNIEFSRPYMHDGRFKNLREVLNNHAVTDLSPDQKVDLMAFLLTLTDQSFLFNPLFSFPRE